MRQLSPDSGAKTRVACFLHAEVRNRQHGEQYTRYFPGAFEISGRFNGV